MGILLGVLGGAVVLALALAGVSLWATLRAGSVPELEHQVAKLRLEVTDVVDRLEQWQKRDRVRRLREGREDADAGASLAAPAELSRAQRIAELRARAGNRRA